MMRSEGHTHRKDEAQPFRWRYPRTCDQHDYPQSVVPHVAPLIPPEEDALVVCDAQNEHAHVAKHRHRTIAWHKTSEDHQKDKHRVEVFLQVRGLHDAGIQQRKTLHRHDDSAVGAGRSTKRNFYARANDEYQRMQSTHFARVRADSPSN